MTKTTKDFSVPATGLGAARRATTVLPASAYFFGFESIDGLCRNVPSRITGGKNEHVFDVTTAGDCTTAVTIRLLSKDDQSLMPVRVTSEETFEFEYDR